MARKKRTKSEHLFEELCDEHNMVWLRLPELDNRQQPDYELRISAHLVVAEVKQIEPNDGDKQFTDELRNNGHASRRDNPNMTARRVRKQIKESSKQIKSYLENNPGTPALLVLFDNSDNSYDDPYIIQTAMYGYEQALIAPAQNGEAPTLVDQGFAPRNDAEIRADKHQRLSAAVTMHEFVDRTADRTLSLNFYHNRFADHPFDPQWWAGDDIAHWVLSEKTPGEFQDWERVTLENVNIESEPDG